MVKATTTAALLAVAGITASAADIAKISGLWGELSTYKDNAADAFGVQYVGLPDGCQVVSQQQRLFYAAPSASFANLSIARNP